MLSLDISAQNATSNIKKTYVEGCVDLCSKFDNNEKSTSIVDKASLN